MQAVPFITVDDETGAFQIDETAQGIISAIEGKIAIVSVAGLYRTGKSYLMNLLINRQDQSRGVRDFMLRLDRYLHHFPKVCCRTNGECVHQGYLDMGSSTGARGRDDCFVHGY